MQCTKQYFFMIQLCVVFDLFTIKAVKRHFRLDFVTSRWGKAITDFHLTRIAAKYLWRKGILVTAIRNEARPYAG